MFNEKKQSVHFLGGAIMLEVLISIVVVDVLVSVLIIIRSRQLRRDISDIRRVLAKILSR